MNLYVLTFPPVFIYRSSFPLRFPRLSNCLIDSSCSLPQRWRMRRRARKIYRRRRKRFIEEDKLMDGMLSASSQLQDSIVKFSNRGKWRENVTAQCPNLVHAAAPHKKVHLWCPTVHNGINSLPSVVILKPVLPIRDKTWEIFHISMSGGVLISQSFFVIWSQANAFFTISGQRWDFARLMYWLIYFQIFMFQNFAKRLDSKPILFRLILVPVSFFLVNDLSFKILFSSKHTKKVVGSFLVYSE